jgi:hypothetical protein
MPKPKLSFGEALLAVLAEPQNWRDFGYGVTGVGFAAAPDWWQYVTGFGLVVCPLVARVLQAIHNKRMEG